MDQQHKFSNRIKTIASYLSKNTFFADIGTDHAYLPCYVCLHDSKTRAIAGEINEGPYKSACETIHYYHLNDQIEVRQGNGLSILQNDPVEELVIAGMGGVLIARILEEGKHHLQSVNRIIAQPNTGEHNVRKWMIVNGFKIVNESLVKENHHIYEIIVAENNIDGSETKILNEKQYLLGSILLEEKSPLFYEKWHSRLLKTKHIKHQVTQSKQHNDAKLAKLNKKIQWIKEAIQDDND